jgi:hypothetical protein
MLHEERNSLSKETLNKKRAIDSLKEELEAVDWYMQRADACDDEELKKILLHNAKEEKEHAAMLVEWLRKNDSEMENELKDYLFKDDQDVTEIEEESK